MPAPPTAAAAAAAATAAATADPRTTLTPEVQDQICQAIGLGGTITIAARAAGVRRDVVHRWLRRGRADVEIELDTPYARFAVAVDVAKGKGDVQLLAAIRAQVQGRRCKICSGLGAVRACDAGGRPKDTRLIRCSPCKGSGYATIPDGRLALDVLARRYPEDYGREDRLRHEVTGRDGGPIQIDNRVAALAVDLAGLSPAQLTALAWGAEPTQLAGPVEGALDLAEVQALDAAEAAELVASAEAEAAELVASAEAEASAEAAEAEASAEAAELVASAELVAGEAAGPAGT